MPTPDLKTLRQLYRQAASGPEAATKLYDLLQDYAGSDAVTLAYKAASEALKARDASMLSKLGYVKQAAQGFEQAVRRDPQNGEVRFLRFSVESNLPALLGMSPHVAEDRQFLIETALSHPNSGVDGEAFTAVREFLVGRQHVSADDARRLNQIQP